MNDSFLEDLELPCTLKPCIVDKHVTTRAVASSTFMSLEGEEELCDKKQLVEEPNSKDSKKLLEHETRKLQTSAKVSERKEKHEESKFKLIEDKVSKYGSSSREHKPKIRFAEGKTVGEDKVTRSGSYKENVKATNFKENSRSDSSKEGATQIEDPIEKTKDCDKKLDSKEIDHTTLLSAIEDIVSMNSRKETTRILKAVQDVHISAQASLLKHLQDQSDEIVEEINSYRDSKKIKRYIEENAHLREDICSLQKKLGKMQDKLELLEFLKQENKTLKKEVSRLVKELHRQ